MRTDAMVIGTIGFAVLAHAGTTTTTTSSGSESPIGWSASLLEVLVGFATCVYAALRGSERFRPLRVERGEAKRPYDGVVSDFDAHGRGGRGAAARAFVRRE
jgi:hypothetical protein